MNTTQGYTTHRGYTLNAQHMYSCRRLTSKDREKLHVHHQLHNMLHPHTHTHLHARFIMHHTHLTTRLHCAPHHIQTRYTHDNKMAISQDALSILFPKLTAPSISELPPASPLFEDRTILPFYEVDGSQRSQKLWK